MRDFNPNETLYRKVGRRYVAVNDPWAYNGLRDGHWHVIVRPGNTTIRTPVWPDRMCEGKCRQLPRDVEERGWQAFHQATDTPPTEPLTFYGPSMQAVVDAGIAALRERL